MAKRVRAPGVDSSALESILARMRVIGREVRKLETQLAESPPSAHPPIVKKLDRLFIQRQNEMEAWVEATLPRVAASGVAYASGAIGVPFEISPLMRRAIAELQKNTAAEIASSTTYLKLDTKRLLRELADQTTELATVRGLSIPETRAILAHRMNSLGLRAFQDASGRRWKLNTYSEMLARTRTAQAYNTGTVLRCVESGVNAFQVFDGSQDEACSAANGKIVSASWAFANPIAHPNCTRAFGPVPDFEGTFDVPAA